MADDSELRRDLLWRIESRRAAVQAFLRTNRPRTRRRATIALVLSSLAALFTAGPAVGGQTFAEGVQKTLNLASDSYVWRVLCLLALLVSVGAAVLANISKSTDDVARLSAAEAANAELEGLTTLLEFGQLTVPDAVKLYQSYSVKIPFIDDQPGEEFGHRGPPPQGAGYYTPAPPGPGHYAPPPQRPGYPPSPPRP
jgi:hypothetical protein